MSGFNNFRRLCLPFTKQTLFGASLKAKGTRVLAPALRNLVAQLDILLSFSLCFQYPQWTKAGTRKVFLKQLLAADFLIIASTLLP
jgi:hypothetical protein